MENDETQKDSIADSARPGPGLSRQSPVIERFQVQQKIGEGGMGEVWLAEQIEPVRRRVAIKVIKEGMDTKRVVARFEAERQALAMMDHPGLARVFEAGSTDMGRPYFVMEYVAGTPINEYCDGNRLSNRDRLELFLRVCEAVQHAHQKAIIHRDLKPSNVLVTVADGKAVPKIIDFGVAKAIGSRLTEQTLFTEIGIMLGTPEYMSPEQASLTPQDVDTRTDVYSLGVILYQLIVGALPFESDDLRRSGVDGIRKQILEHEPQKPSARLATFGGERSTESARRRSVDPTTLKHQISGDLDWITMKALEKDRTRRYGSPAELAADIVRFLHDEPVLAGPPSRAYRARKFVRRHRLGVAVATSAAAVLVVFALFAGISARRVAKERDRANEQAKTADSVARFLASLFSASDPREAKGHEPTARELLDRGVERIDKELSDQPAVRARLQGVLGTVYTRLGRYDTAVKLLEESLATSRSEFGDGAMPTLRAMAMLGWAYRGAGRDSEAEALYVRAIDGFKRLIGENDPITLKAMSDLAVIYDREGRSTDVEALDRRILATRRTALGADHPDTLMSMNNLGWVVLSAGRFREAEALLREAFTGFRGKLGPDHPDTLLAMSNLAMSLGRQGRYADAEALIRESYEIDRRVLGENNDETMDSLTGLANCVLRQGRVEEAEALFRRAYEGTRASAGDADPNTAYEATLLADAMATGGKCREAEALVRPFAASMRQVQDNPVAALADGVLAYALACQRRDAEVDGLLTGSVERSRRLFGAQSRTTARALLCKARAEALLGRRDAAIGTLEQAAETGRAEPGVLASREFASMKDDLRFRAVAAKIDAPEGRP